MSSSARILTGLFAGIVVGLFVGERAQALDWAADGYVRLLQMTVLPYVTISIILSLGRLDYAQARMLGLRGGAVIAGLWLVALSFAFLIPLTFPDIENASFFSTSMVQRREPFDLVALYVPANPFHALTFSVVPAVVVFSVLVGVALIGVERKHQLLDVLDTAAAAVSRATRLVATLTPFGLFAIAASTAGTLNVDELARLQVYLISYAAIALLLSVIVLPGLVAALTPVPYTAVLRETQGPVITACVAGDLFIVLPSLIEASKSLIAKYGREDAPALVDAIVPISYNFPHSGKLLSISFILFAGWFADVPVPTSEYPQLAVTGLLTFFGSLNAAVPFLLGVFRIPADTFELFLATGVINSRFGTLVAAMHTVTVAILGTCAVAGLLRWNRRRAVRFAIIAGTASVCLIGGARTLFGTVLAPEYQADDVLASMDLRERPVTAVVHRTGDAVAPADATPTLDALRTRRPLSVGYLSDAVPFAYFNGRDDLVGFDVELAHRLAAELGVDLRFVPVARERLDVALEDGTVDLVMSGVAVTTERAARLLFSTPYLYETLGLLVADHARDRFRSWAAIRDLGPLSIGVPDLPYLTDKLQRLLPAARLKTIRSSDELFGAEQALDAVALPAERGSTWTLVHPEFSMLVPEGELVKVPLAYPIGRRDASFAAFMNAWIELKRKDGTLDRAYTYWILGQRPEARRPRWSIGRDVLHWWD